jgi:hypothetical protein
MITAGRLRYLKEIMTKAKPLAALAPQIAAANPKTAGAVLAIFKTMILPLLPVILGEILKADTKGRYTKYLRAARNVLVDADLGDDED